MSFNATPLGNPSTLQNYYVVCSLSGVSSLIAVLISLLILILVRRTKPRLHTVRHLLMCNTCIASIFYCVVQSVNYVYLIFLPWETSDISCRWRSYFGYMTLCASIYSYFIQAISRLFISIFSATHRWLSSFRAHYLLILVQWSVVALLPLPAILTTDVRFRPLSLCWVPKQHLIHVTYTYIAYYIFPTLSIGIIYVYIYYRVKQTAKRASSLIRSSNSSKRDLELLRNILILLIIYLLGGVPSILFILTGANVIYLASIVTISSAVAIEKICAILLDRDIRQVVLGWIRPGARVMPFDQSHTGGRGLENLYQTQVT